MSGVRERYVLAIDLGTGSVKTALVSTQAEAAALASREIQMLHLPGGGAEQDPAQWWSATCEAARETLQQAALRHVLASMVSATRSSCASSGRRSGRRRIGCSSPWTI